MLVHNKTELMIKIIAFLLFVVVHACLAISYDGASLLNGDCDEFAEEKLLNTCSEVLWDKDAAQDDLHCFMDGE